MANKIQKTDIKSTTIVPPTSRYVNSEVIYYGNDNYLTYTTYKKQNQQSSSSDKYSVIPPGMEYRPDKVSSSVYGTPDFWWKIMEANNIMDVFDFKSGRTIKIPQSIL
jgi:hypothetical protein